MKDFSERFQVSICGLSQIDFYVNENSVRMLIDSFRSAEAIKNVNSVSIFREILKGEKYENKFISISLRKELLPKKPVEKKPVSKQPKI
ncbi:MAG: hypothetical protein EKK64_04300 [Neisseriaceae bacterium]|nr:MAG: hypothetical protein EKK64_04300 [Neisseriaceae bacterium]